MARVDVSVFVAVDGATVGALRSWLSVCGSLGVPEDTETSGAWARPVDDSAAARFGWVGGTVGSVAEWVARLDAAEVADDEALTAPAAELGVQIPAAVVEAFECSDHLGEHPAALMLSPHRLCEAHGPVASADATGRLSVSVERIGGPVRTAAAATS